MFSILVYVAIFFTLTNLSYTSSRLVQPLSHRAIKSMKAKYWVFRKNKLALEPQDQPDILYLYSNQLDIVSVLYILYI